MPKLEVKANGKTRTVSFDGRTVTLGRSKDNDVVLAENHAAESLLDRCQTVAKIFDLRDDAFGRLRIKTGCGDTQD